MKKAFYSIFLSFFLMGMFAQKAELAFKGDREKSAQFEYSKSELDSLFTHFFKEPFPLSIAGKFTIDMELLLTVDTSGKVTGVKFEKLVTDSDIMPAEGSQDAAKMFQGMRDSIRKIVYLTNGMWTCKTKKGKKVISEVLVKTTLKKRSDKVFQDLTEEEKEKHKGGTIYYFEVKTKKSNPDFFYNYGLSLYNAAKFKMAKVYFDSVTKLSPKDKDAFYYMGMCNQKLNNTKEACNNWNTCQQLGDKNVSELLKQNCN